MVSTFTPNIQIEEPARGDDVGTWDTPVNNNSTLLDLVAGGATTITLNNANVTLSAAQFQSRMLVFNSTLTGSVVITFPTSFTKDYAIWNQCSGSSAFTITCKTTATNPTFICPPPGEIVDIYNLGGNIYFKNLERVGSYWDYAGSSVPAWVSGSSPAPYLNCDGTSFSSASYPQLAVVLAGTTLPDRRGTVGVTLNQGTGRTTSNVNANVNYTVGGADVITLNLSMLPTGINSNANNGIVVTFGGLAIPGANAPIQNALGPGSGGGNYAFTGGTFSSVTTASGTQNITVTSNNTGGAAHSNTQPTTVYGLTLIRAA